MKRCLIAGSASGGGKTSITLAIEAAFCRRGLAVQPFKCGPDYLDTAHHSRVCRRPCRNLDSVMLSPLENARSLIRAAHGADMVIAEGMMGLFDGVSGASNNGSSAEIARLLDMPVVLVLDASNCSRSIAATVLGFTSFDPGLRFAGIILNRVAGEAHFKMLSDAIRGTTSIPLLGWLPRDPQWTVAERHLGLHDAGERGWEESELLSLAQAAEQHIDLDQLLQAASSAPLPIEAEVFTDVNVFTDANVFTDVNVFTNAEAALPPEPSIGDDHIASPLQPNGSDPIRLGLACDAAFSFYYQDNLDLLRDAGAEL